MPDATSFHAPSVFARRQATPHGRQRDARFPDTRVESGENATAGGSDRKDGHPHRRAPAPTLASIDPDPIIAVTVDQIHQSTRTTLNNDLRIVEYTTPNGLRWWPLNGHYCFDTGTARPRIWLHPQIVAACTARDGALW